MSETVRIKPESHAKLKELAESAGAPMSEMLERAIEAYRRQQFLESSNQAFAALRGDAKAWKEEMAEREVWDASLVDGLEDE